MAWDDSKSDFGSSPRVADSKKLKAEEWNAHVQDQLQRLKHLDVEDNGTLTAETGTINFRENLSVTTDSGDAVVDSIGGSQFNFSPGHSNWGSVTDKEIHRYHLDDGKSLEITDIQFYSRGGGTENTSASVEVYDVDDTSPVVSTNLNTKSSPSASSTAGAVVTVRVTNGTGDNIDASVTIRGNIV